MSSNEPKLQIALEMLSRVESTDTRPYLTLKWLAENVYDGKHWDSYFIAVNILRSRGVENAKRGPLTTLTQKERGKMRVIGKNLAAMISSVSRMPSTVVKNPIKICGSRGEPYLSISCQTAQYCVTYLHPTKTELENFDNLSSDGKLLFVRRVVESHFMSQDQWLASRLDVVKADLEKCFERVG